MDFKKKCILLGILVIMIIIGAFLLGSSYALFNTSQISKSAVTIKVGTMTPFLGLDLYVPKGESDTFTIYLENKENVSGKFLLFYKGNLPDGVTFGYVEKEGMDVPLKEGVVIGNGDKKSYFLYVNNQSSNDITIELDAIGGLSNQSLSLPAGGNYIEKVEMVIPELNNSHIKKILKYDQNNASTKCITGEESTCVEITEKPDTYALSTIIKYEVAEKIEKYFYVISDNGDTLTLQQREDTLTSIKWYEDSTNKSNSTKGPLNALPLLEDATSGWSNVLDQTYTMGTTFFQGNPYTGCSGTSCTSNIYTLPERTAKARMITVQELVNLNCKHNIVSCPLWVSNYMSKSTEYGGTVNGISYAYWTMSASGASCVYQMSYQGTYGVQCNTMSTMGVRAVIMIKK